MMLTYGRQLHLHADLHPHLLFRNPKGQYPAPHHLRNPVRNLHRLARHHRGHQCPERRAPQAILPLGSCQFPPGRSHYPGHNLLARTVRSGNHRRHLLGTKTHRPLQGRDGALGQFQSPPATFDYVPGNQLGEYMRTHRIHLPGST